MSKKTIDASAIVKETYGNFNENNKKADFKFTAPMVTIVVGNIFTHDTYQEANELIDTLYKDPELSDISRYYLDRCNEKLKEYDPRDIKGNLKKMDLL